MVRIGLTTYSCADELRCGRAHELARVVYPIMASALIAALLAVGGLLLSPTPAESAAGLPAPGLEAFKYDPPSAAMTSAVNTRNGTARGDHAPAGRSRPSTSRIALSLAAKGAVRGGAGPVRVGQAGEDAVRGVYNIGEKVPITVGKRGRIPDGLTDTTLSEVKNVSSLSYTSQLRDFASYARDNRLTVDLFTRPDTRLSGPLREALADPAVPIRLRSIP